MGPRFLFGAMTARLWREDNNLKCLTDAKMIQ